MVLKSIRNSQALESIEGNAVGDEWSGPWGTISTSQSSTTTLRLITRNGVVDYPYRLIGRRTLREGTPQIIELEIAGDRVVISGHRLMRLFDALSKESLEVVQEQVDHDDFNSVPIGLHVTSIKIEERTP